MTESVVTTPGPDGRWNVAALGVSAPDDGGMVTARTWGQTRTRHNFSERGTGYVQFTRDPVDFVEAALSIRVVAEPVLASTDAWVRVTVSRLDSGQDRGTEWVCWRLTPVEATVERRIVPTINRGHTAIIEATVAASRLDVEAYETADLLDRLAHYERVVDTCGGPAEHAAWARLEELVDWRDP